MPDIIEKIFANCETIFSNIQKEKYEDVGKQSYETLFTLLPQLPKTDKLHELFEDFLLVATCVAKNDKTYSLDDLVYAYNLLCFEKKKSLVLLTAKKNLSNT